MKFGEIATITKRDATVGILVILAYMLIVLGGVYILNYMGGVF